MAEAPNHLIKRTKNFPKPNVSGEGEYYAFVTTVEQATGPKAAPGALEIAFELVPKEWTDAAWLTPSNNMKTFTRPKDIPQLLYHLPAITVNDLQKLLQLKPGEVVAEGQWYLITLGDENARGAAGEFIDLLLPDDPPGPGGRANGA